MYVIFHSKFQDEDLLYLILDPYATPNRSERKGDVVALYRDNTLVGVNYFHRGEGMKTGLIPHPTTPLLFVLTEAAMGFELPLLEEEPSGYRVCEVISIEEHPLDERKRIVHLRDLENEYETTTRYANFQVGDHLVCLLDHHFRFDGTFFEKSISRNIHQDVEICSPKDLEIGEEGKEAYSTDLPVGTDFFA